MRSEVGLEPASQEFGEATLGDAAAGLRPDRLEVQQAQERSKWSLGVNLSHSTRAATEEAKHLHELARAGESEWTPWIVIAGLILFYAAVGLLMFGIVEAASHLLANASSGD